LISLYPSAKADGNEGNMACKFIAGPFEGRVGKQ
jgi:hypothetical protein